MNWVNSTQASPTPLSAALIARGHSVETAADTAQKWVYQTLMNATKPGKEKDSQWLPDRTL